MRATVILCYGQVALMAPQHLLLERFEVPVFRDLQTFLPTCKVSNDTTGQAVGDGGNVNTAVSELLK